MMEIPLPYDLEAYKEGNEIEQIVMIKDFMGFLERLLNDAQERLTPLMAIAAEKKLETEDYYIQVKYKEGKSFTPDPELLLAYFPEKYKQWKDAEIAKYKPKMTKTAFEALWQTVGHTRAEKKESKEKNLAEMQQCMREHPVATQYILASVQAREEWKKNHPIEEADA